MKKFYIIILLCTLIFLTQSRCSNYPSKCDDCSPVCKQREPKVKNEFWLSIAPSKKVNDSSRFQTIFIESPKGESTDVFVIAATMAQKNNSDGSVDLIFNKLSIRRLSGKNYKVHSISEGAPKVPGGNKHIILNIVEVPYTPNNDENVKEVNFILNKIDPKIKFDVDVCLGTGHCLFTRICQIYIGN